MATKRSYMRAKWGVYTGSFVLSLTSSFYYKIHPRHGLLCFLSGLFSRRNFSPWIFVLDNNMGSGTGTGRRGRGLSHQWARSMGPGSSPPSPHHHHHTTIITTTSTITIWAEIFFCRLKFFLSLLSSSLRGGLGWASFATCVISTYHPAPHHDHYGRPPAQGPY
ncbi:hypothetical protein IWX90DRAFT_434433 [Phyllosticta citrichinensis]|uniref:Uncharacterized protein n=1 Tax=Phyllosticta citrichinensis TaxID=1130410 RepID=A0ABR1XUZ7_9PEZI